ncbi:hypothetical protein [Asanoa siamensis]|uniref:Uncharacterized protein n=1 Tax=Asanoa siamensis TaxID=926357 RepID=A0ABQ4CS56_9ACTN|nr:hypothetical protein [Asanoa siamensis]GIF74120.1 hypothetical protein Asi02nite_36380 [Asanoa siamensis]
MNPEPADALLDHASRSAVAAANAERLGVLADHMLTDLVGYDTEAAKAPEQTNQRREGLRAALRDALPATVQPMPDDELPVCTHVRGQVEVRATFDHGRRGILVCYTPAQALAGGAALIACAAITDDKAGGAIAAILLALPPNPAANVAPADETRGGQP